MLLTAAGLATIVGPLSADWNTSHIFNERWPSHARFHGVVGLCTPLALTLYGLWHLWTSSGQRPLATATATAVPVAYWGSFFPAMLVKGTGLDDPQHPVGRVAGMPANVFWATTTMAMALAGCLLDRRGRCAEPSRASSRR
jgi:hypothetical protein